MDTLQKIQLAANSFYNRGLELAKERDLSGAAGYLKRALELNKYHTDARNLLGLIFYEMGETSDALVQWVISVNLQPEENRADHYLDEVQRKPGQLEIEVTESAGNVDNRSLAEVLERFRSYGLHFSLDDFGSQYANLSIFTNVRFDSVKLDRSLIADLTSNVRCQMLIRDLVSICHTCNMICVAEGVETQAQIDALSNAGCAYGQGYFFDRPIPADVFQDRYLHPAQA